MLSEPLMGEAEDDNYKWLRLFATVTAVALGSSLQFGFATGSLNNLEQIVPEDLAAAGNPIVTWQWALINSMFSVGGLIGSYGVVVPLAYFGRKNTLLLANFFVFLSSALMYLGTVWWVLVLGRVSIGVVAGVAQMVAGSYMTEISPIGVRGSVGVCSQVGIVLGISLASYLTAPSFAVFGTIDRWRFTFLVPCVSSPSSSACSRQPQPCALTPALHPAPCAVRLAPDPSPRPMQVPLLTPARAPRRCLFSLFQICVLPFCPESPAFLIKNQGEEATWTVGHTRLECDASEGPQHAACHSRLRALPRTDAQEAAPRAVRR